MGQRAFECAKQEGCRVVKTYRVSLTEQSVFIIGIKAENEDAAISRARALISKLGRIPVAWMLYMKVSIVKMTT